IYYVYMYIVVCLCVYAHNIYLIHMHLHMYVHTMHSNLSCIYVHSCLSLCLRTYILNTYTSTYVHTMHSYIQTTYRIFLKAKIKIKKAIRRLLAVIRSHCKVNRKVVCEIENMFCRLLEHSMLTYVCVCRYV